MGRPGKRERARVKRRNRRLGLWCSVWGVGTGLVYLGRKKWASALRASHTRTSVTR